MSAAEHRVDWGITGWSCSCGAGREWALSYSSNGSVGRAKAAAQKHQFSVWRKENAPQRATDAELSEYVARREVKS